VEEAEAASNSDDNHSSECAASEAALTGTVAATSSHTHAHTHIHTHIRIHTRIHTRMYVCIIHIAAASSREARSRSTLAVFLKGQGYSHFTQHHI